MLKKFLRRHKAVAAVLLLFVLTAVYFFAVALKAYFDTPRVLAEAERSGRLALRLEDVPPEYLRALLAVEDPNFYAHGGVDLSTPGAGWTTITQGLVKVYFFPEGFTPGLLRQRKVSQSVIAWVFDRRVDKDTQLRLFVNSVYLGHREGREVVGFRDGAREYFGKEFGELGEDEFLSLVAMIVAPNEFNVAAQPEKNHERVRRIKRLLAGECRPDGVGDVYYERCA